MTEAELLALLRTRVETRYGGQAAFAREHGISPGLVADLLNRRRPMTPQVAAVLGFKPVIIYVPLEVTE